MTDFLEFFNRRTGAMIDLLEQLVRMESPTSSKAHVDALGDHVAGLCRALGAEIEQIPQPDVGDIRLAKWHPDAPGKPVLVLCHLDTVWPVGTLDTMPLRREGDLLYGPGALDMKGGVVIALEAIRGLIDRGELPERPIWLMLTGDEETGSQNTREPIRDKAGQCGLVLVMEPAAEGEALKVWRKGVAHYMVYTIGRASHAGNAPEAGINAIIEAAHQALALHALNDLPNGTSVSVTTVRGGIANNVIPPEAALEVDVRFLKASEAERVDRAIKTLSPVLPGAGVRVEGGIDRGPMERDEQMVRVFAQAQAIACSIGLEVGEAGSGGASDGNFTAAMGLPTLDGLGAGGIGLHAAHEQVVVRSLPRRAALLAKLLCDWDMDAV
ncbi:MAG: M20 family metallopeptidase [Anaerolineae bacterium]|nr:M20 family metallopeptidase [Anaerolineae bacterium]